MRKPRIAFVYDRVNKLGGAERVLAILHKIWPEAPLYTSVYDPQKTSWAKNFQIITSFVQKIPLAKSRHEYFPWLMPMAFESFDFSHFDLVISLTSAEAKGIITPPGTCHICYCLTPTRYLWSHLSHYHTPWILKPIFSYLRVWDKIASQRPDYYLAISKNVAWRIKKYYGRESTVIYPPLNLSNWRIIDGHDFVDDYFLIVSRLVAYKKIDLAIQVFNKLKIPLKIIGGGTEIDRLKKIAGETIEFLGQLTDSELLVYYQNCKAVIFPQEEDFGLVSLEAQACGKPIIAYGAGGALETIVEGKTGEFFYSQTQEELEKLIANFNVQEYNSLYCRKNAEKFRSEIFEKRFRWIVENLWRTYLKNTSIS